MVGNLRKLADYCLRHYYRDDSGDPAALEELSAAIRRRIEEVPLHGGVAVDTLFIEIGAHVWGVYDEVANRIEIHDERQPGDEDLLDLAAVHTFLQGGTVHALRPENMPGENGLAATFRYAADVAAEER